MRLKRHIGLLVAVGVAAALPLPVALAGTPNGAGLFGEHLSHCTGAVVYDGLVTLVPGAGNSFWVNGHHLVIQSATITYDDPAVAPITYTFGQKTGKTDANVTCTGDFPGYHVQSYDLVVP